MYVCMYVIVCVRVRERETERGGGGERESLRVCVSVSVSVCVCVCVCVCACVCACHARRRRIGLCQKSNAGTKERTKFINKNLLNSTKKKLIWCQKERYRHKQKNERFSL